VLRVDNATIDPGRDPSKPASFFVAAGRPRSAGEPFADDSAHAKIGPNRFASSFFSVFKALPILWKALGIVRQSDCMQHRIQDCTGCQPVRYNLLMVNRSMSLNPSVSVVDRVYEEMRGLLVSHDLRPGDRVNEVELSKQFGVSRTPLREALNRLRSEGFLSFVPKRGYFCRHLNPKEVFDLFELRKAIEISGIKLAMLRVKDQQIDVLSRFLDDAEFGTAERTIEELARLDERFHERLLEVSGNTEMVRVLRNVNARIWPVRWTDWNESTRAKSRADHRALLSALRSKDQDRAVEILDSHITRRIDQITAAIKERIARIYLSAQDLANVE